MNLIDPLILNNGFHLIAEEIFNNLDLKSLAKSRQVSKLWKEFIDNNRVLLIHQVRQAKQLRITKRLAQKKIIKRRLKRQKCDDFEIKWRTKRCRVAQWELEVKWQIESKLAIPDLKIYFSFLKWLHHGFLFSRNLDNPLRMAIVHGYKQSSTYQRL